jgi:hypothetical protein
VVFAITTCELHVGPGQRRRAVETEPPEQQHDDAEERHRDVVAGYRLRLAFAVVLADARPEHHCAGERGHAVHQGVADHEERRERGAEDCDVHAHRVRGVLLAREAGLHEREPRLHEHHERTTYADPQQVDVLRESADAARDVGPDRGGTRRRSPTPDDGHGRQADERLITRGSREI